MAASDVTQMTRNPCEEALNVRRCEQGREGGRKPRVGGPRAAAELLAPVVVVHYG